MLLYFQPYCINNELNFYFYYFFFSNTLLNLLTNSVELGFNRIVIETELINKIFKNIVLSIKLIKKVGKCF